MYSGVWEDYRFGLHSGGLATNDTPDGEWYPLGLIVLSNRFSCLLQVLERNSSEFNVTRTYLDWLTSIPWGKY